MYLLRKWPFDAGAARVRSDENRMAACTVRDRRSGECRTAVVLRRGRTSVDIGGRRRARDLDQRTAVDVRGQCAEGYGSRGWHVGSVAKCVAQPADISGRRRTDAESVPKPCRLYGRARTPADDPDRLCKAGVRGSSPLVSTGTLTDRRSSRAVVSQRIVSRVGQGRPKPIVVVLRPVGVPVQSRTRVLVSERGLRDVDQHPFGETGAAVAYECRTSWSRITGSPAVLACCWNQSVIVSGWIGRPASRRADRCRSRTRRGRPPTVRCTR